MKAYRRSQAQTDARSHATGDFDVFSAQDLGVDVSFMRAALQGRGGKWRGERIGAWLLCEGQGMRYAFIARTSKCGPCMDCVG